MGELVYILFYCQTVSYNIHSVPCSTFSQDSSLMAAGFTESYIRIWNLKGEKLRGLRSDFDSDSVRDSKLLLINNVVAIPLIFLSMD